MGVDSTGEGSVVGGCVGGWWQVVAGDARGMVKVGGPPPAFHRPWPAVVLFVLYVKGKR